MANDISNNNYVLQLGKNENFRYEVTPDVQKLLEGVMFRSNCLEKDKKERDAVELCISKGMNVENAEETLNELEHRIKEHKLTMRDLMEDMEKKNVPNWVGNGAIAFGKNNDLATTYMSQFFRSEPYGLGRVKDLAEKEQALQNKKPQEINTVNNEQKLKKYEKYNWKLAVLKTANHIAEVLDGEIIKNTPESVIYRNADNELTEYKNLNDMLLSFHETLKSYHELDIAHGDAEVWEADLKVIEELVKRTEKDNQLLKVAEHIADFYGAELKIDFEKVVLTNRKDIPINDKRFFFYEYDNLEELLLSNYDDLKNWNCDNLKEWQEDWKIIENLQMQKDKEDKTCDFIQEICANFGYDVIFFESGHIATSDLQDIGVVFRYHNAEEFFKDWYEELDERDKEYVEIEGKDAELPPVWLEIRQFINHEFPEVKAMDIAETIADNVRYDYDTGKITADILDESGLEVKDTKEWNSIAEFFTDKYFEIRNDKFSTSDEIAFILENYSADISKSIAKEVANFYNCTAEISDNGNVTIREKDNSIRGEYSSAEEMLADWYDTLTANSRSVSYWQAETDFIKENILNETEKEIDITD